MVKPVGRSRKISNADNQRLGSGVGEPESGNPDAGLGDGGIVDGGEGFEASNWVGWSCLMVVCL